MNSSLLTTEQARLRAAEWLLANDKQHICSLGNVLGERFAEAYQLPDYYELFGSFAGDEGEIILVMSAKIRLAARESVSGRTETLLIQKYLVAEYDAEGRLTGEKLLGYRC